MWFYVDNNGNQVGPVDEAQVDALVKAGAITRTTQVWHEGMEEWKPAVQTQLSKLFFTVPPPVAVKAIPPYGRPIPAYYQNPDSMKKMWLWWAILCGAGYPLSFIIIGIPMVIAGAVLGFILLYRWWESIQDGSPRTTPGKAVGYLFIPFFNFYWIYVAYVGLVKDINVYCRERAIPAKVDEGMALAYFILLLTTFIPYVGMVTALGSLVVGIILTKQITETVIAIIKTKQSK